MKNSMVIYEIDGRERQINNLTEMEARELAELLSKREEVLILVGSTPYLYRGGRCVY